MRGKPIFILISAAHVMHPLRFPDSGIRAKEEGWLTPIKGRPPTARPATRGSRLRPWPPARGRPATAKAPCRGSRQYARSPTGVGSTHGQAARGSRLRPGRKGQPPATRPQGAAACDQAAGGGCPLRGRKGGYSCRGRAHARWHRAPARCCPRSAALTVGAAAHADGVQRRRLRRAATTVVAQ
ncbi:hypothetical protein BHE74_00043694 [Ensete ventricosum]|nr:hypothetical protein GW17_00056067 [Ensete ventricosum]RWW50065.1 hypothetical protein BHE74_00043694 [Ensete ventricosum]